MTAFPATTPGLRAPDPAHFACEATPTAADHAVPLRAAATDGYLLAGRTGTLAAFGSAAVLELPRGLSDPEALRDVTRWLRAVDRRASGRLSAPAVVALGAFPFDPRAPAELVVPSTTWCTDATGRSWQVEVRRHGAPRTTPAVPLDGAGDGPDDAAPGTAPRGWGRPELDQVPTGQGYAEAVARAVGDIAAGRLRKVVLSRALHVRLPRAPTAGVVLERLWGGDPAFHPYSVPVGHGRMVGASPELLIERQARDVVSHAFAGTVALDGSHEQAVARLLASAKDREEHRLVVDAIAEALEPRCSRLEVPREPSAVRLRSDARLGSLLHGTLRGDDSALELLGLLHPTPAVGGVPRAAALEEIRALEPPRGHWAGAVGWVDAEGDGSWVLAIRGALLEGVHAVLRAGAGIVSRSDPASELAETTVKLSPVLEALWPGASSLR